MPISFNLLPNCLDVVPKEPKTNGTIFTHIFQIFCNSFLDRDTFVSSLSPLPQSYYLQELQINYSISSPLLINYSQTCIRRPLLEPLKSGCLGKAVVL